MCDPCLFPTMPPNKALLMVPHVSCLVRPVTEYSAKHGSSGFSCGYWPGMDTSRLLLTLEQGLRSLEDYIREYLEIAYYSEGPRSSLSDFMDYALITDGSAFTVGVTGERDAALIRVMADAQEHAHKMATTSTPHHVIAASHESSHN